MTHDKLFKDDLPLKIKFMEEIISHYPNTVVSYVVQENKYDFFVKLEDNIKIEEFIKQSRKEFTSKVNFLSPINLIYYNNNEKRYENGGGGFNGDFPNNLK